MIIQYASDLHLEFTQNKRFLSTNPLQPSGDVLILAGDVVPFAQLDNYNDFFDYLADHFKTTYWIPGNHEYYQFDLAEKCGLIHEEIRKNVHLVNNIVLKQEGIRFVFSTLWSNISPSNQTELQKSLYDFQAINYKSKPFDVTLYNEKHQVCLDFVTSALKQVSVDKTVVVTHHVPTWVNYPEKYRGIAMSEAFAVGLDHLIEITQPNCWIYGHHHNNTPDFKVGNTQMLTNQLGYVKNGGDRYFSTDMTFDL